eukprot:300084-Rhodomonas_salina.1
MRVACRLKRTSTAAQPKLGNSQRNPIQCLSLGRFLSFRMFSESFQRRMLHVYTLSAAYARPVPDIA